MGTVLLRLAGIHKRFGGVAALRGATIDVGAGEVVGLVGENGAGKSTLINIATGVLRPDAGTIELSGVPVSISDPRHARRLGIAVVHQEAELFPQLSIAENMLLGQGLGRGRLGLISWRTTYDQAERMIAQAGESFDVRSPAEGLPVARRMMAEIAGAVWREARILFLDEPTSALTRHEIENLFARLRALRSAGVGIVYVSHRLEEVLTLSDRIVVLRDGETVENRSARELTLEAIVQKMVGRELTFGRRPRRRAPGDVRFEVRGATDATGAFRDVSITIRAGEILGMYGFVGAGRSEFAQAIFGLRALARGDVFVDGARVRIGRPREAVRAGLGYVPEDRLVQGIFRGHSLRANASAVMLPRLAWMTLIRSRDEQALARRVMEEMRVMARSPEQAVGTLSGGNQQKVVFGRWGLTNPRVLLLDEPTRGVDVSAKAEIHRIIVEMADAGTAVLLITSELPELMALSDRVVALSEGRVTGTFDPRRDGQDAIARAAVPRDIAAEPGDSARKSLAARVGRMREAGILAAVAVMCLAMAILRPAQFATATNLLDVLANAALPAIMAQGVMLIICAGGIDISIGSMLGLLAASASMCAVNGTPPAVCLGLSMLLGVGCSLANASTALLARIHPIIVTLAGISVYRGVMHVLTGGREVINLPASYRSLADGTLLGVPKICYYVIGVTVLVHMVLEYTLAGRRMLALGNSESAARLAGVSKTRSTLAAFAISGAMIGLAAVLHSGYYGKVQGNTGEGWELRAIAAAVIGGTNILGGRGSALGTLLGALLVALLYNGLILLDVSAYWQHLFIGGLILCAVSFDVGLRRWRGAFG